MPQLYLGRKRYAVEATSYATNCIVTTQAGAFIGPLSFRRLQHYEEDVAGLYVKYGHASRSRPEESKMHNRRWLRLRR